MNVWHKPINVIRTRIVQIRLALLDASVKKDLKWVTREFVKVSKDFIVSGPLFAQIDCIRSGRDIDSVAVQIE